MNSLNKNYVLISPVRNEEKYIQKAIDSMVSQTVRPQEYLIIDDGSTDNTATIIKEAASKHSWIHYEYRADRGERKVGPGVIEAFYDGFNKLRTQNYEYIGKVDGDLSIGPKYFETLFEKFDQDLALGAASGKLFLELDSGKLVAERHSDEMVVGGMQFYRRKCFESIGGFVRQVMWDGIAYHRSRMDGWRTQSFHGPDLIIRDHRIMGSSDKSIFHGRLRWGWGQYFMGTHPLYILAVALYRMLERPFFLGGLLILIGYVKGWVIGSKRYDYPGFRESLHAWQFERLKLGQRIEPTPQAKFQPAV
jgi:biofilm PGA synthesis N-glycosyltransferase PgaC